MNINEVIPLGLSAENAINSIVNNKFEVPASGFISHIPKNSITTLSK